MTELAIPQLSLVALVGVTGSGKSTFARQHFGPYEVLSSDTCRGLVSNDPNDQAATPDAFEVLNFVAGKRLAAGLLTVVDATNVQRDARAELVALARAHDVLPVAIVLDVPEAVCVERNAARPDRAFGVRVVKRQRDALRRSLRGLGREGFRTVHVLTGVDEVDAARIVRTPLRSDLRHLTGPFDVIGDVHGCLGELAALLDRLGYTVVRDEQGRAVDAVPPAPTRPADRRTAVFVGDLVDRGPDSPGVLRLVMGMVAAGHALAVPGNHEAKLVKALRGRDVRISHGLAGTLAQLAREPEEFRDQVERWCDGLVAHLVLDGGRLVVAHAGLKEAYHGRASARVRDFALYGDTTGETDELGLPVRYPWARDYRGRATVLYGHTPTPEPEWVNNTLCLDTGCVFGGRLTALRYPEREVVSVRAEREWYPPARPFPPAGGREGVAAGETAGAATAARASRREPDLLDVADVLGKRVVQTRWAGPVTVRAENAAAALEVMSRFAIDPRWLVYLPPTMPPGPTAPAAPEGGVLERPAEVFAGYRADGVDRVLCEEKHMGSRAVAVVCRDAAAAASRFGVDDGSTGAVYTRTGRAFFGPGLTEQLLGRLRAAAEQAGLWDELGAGWLLLDGELLPWSVKAESLVREQYAAVGAAARAMLPAAVSALAAAQARGLDVGALARRTEARLGNAAAFTEAYRRYVAPTDGLAGVRFAAFQLLASGGGAEAGAGAGAEAGAGAGADGTTYADRDHGWHLSVADRLARAAPDLVRGTRRFVVDTGDLSSGAAGTVWWEELTSAGGEGMVVKPLANLTPVGRRVAQPGVKVRGRDYLRIVYGPDYLEPGNLERLRERTLGHKRSLALREYALGLEALDRLVRGEPLWRVHEPVFAVLALESEPVDPRL